MKGMGIRRIDFKLFFDNCAVKCDNNERVKGEENGEFKKAVD